MGSQEVKVETNNFHQVLEHFDDEGHLKNKDQTRLAIPCGICNDHDLAILNEAKDKRCRQNHETYTVLKCGHAFGYRCIHTWLLQKKTCPTCRESAFCAGDHFVMLEVFGDAGAHEQHEEIKDIRALLKEPARCESCYSGRRNAVAEIPPLQLPPPELSPDRASSRHQPQQTAPVPYEVPLGAWNGWPFRPF